MSVSNTAVGLDDVQLPSSAGASGEQSAPIPKYIPATSRSLWIAVLVASAAVILLRLSTLRAYVEGRIAEQPQVVEQLTDQHLRQLAVNVGLALAMGFSLLLLFMHQSLARTLERHVFSRSVHVGRLRFGLFFLISTMCIVPVGALCAVTGRVSFRSSDGFYLYVLVMAVACPVLYRGHWWSLPRLRVTILFAMALTFGSLATLI